MSEKATISERRSHPLAMFLTWFLVVFLVLFPKGGIKLAGIPFTWGYVAIGVTAPILLIVRLTQMSLTLPMRLVAALAMLIPFQSLFIYSGVANGVTELQYSIGNVISFFFFPLVFLCVYPPFLSYIDGRRLSQYFRWCIFLAAVWGLLLFFVKPVLGHFIEIPYLTVNAADYGQLEATKHIARGYYGKLISTYNNGNLYGVATLILLPLYQVLERSWWRKAVVLAALLLTLARSVWAGLVITEALPLAVLLLRQAETFPVVYLGKALKSVLALILTIGLVFVALLFNAGAGLNFLFDPTAGGRTSELLGFQSAGLVPERGLSGFYEVAYSAAAVNYGWLGFCAFSLIMVSPLLLLLVDPSALRSPTRRAALHGLVLYSIIAWVDGAIQLIPVMAFYWFTYMIFLFGWPGEKASALAKTDNRSVGMKWPRLRFGVSAPASTL